MGKMELIAEIINPDPILKIRTDLDSKLLEIKNKDNKDDREECEKELDIIRRKLEDQLEGKIDKDIEEITFYPELLDKDFTSKILGKKEFLDYQSVIPKKIDIDDACGVSSEQFTLSNPQTFVRNFVSPSTPYNGVLMWWGVGVGKTCGAISIAEQFKTITKKYTTTNKTLVITSGDTISL